MDHGLSSLRQLPAPNFQLRDGERLERPGFNRHARDTGAEISRAEFGSRCSSRLALGELEASVESGVDATPYRSLQRLRPRASRMRIPPGTSTGCAQVSAPRPCSGAAPRTSPGLRRTTIRSPSVVSTTRFGRRRSGSPRSCRRVLRSSTSTVPVFASRQKIWPFRLLREPVDERAVDDRRAHVHRHLGVVPRLRSRQTPSRSFRSDTRTCPFASRTQRAGRRPRPASRCSRSTRQGTAICQSCLPDCDIDADHRLVGHRDQLPAPPKVVTIGDA